ncbi:murein biosynthesis integral membrane protein MurJ [Patescibacteria group bacterium]|nr:murein biosynthesis integral membrane protein MurJ [Patescibacteria group bacterium]
MIKNTTKQVGSTIKRFFGFASTVNGAALLLGVAYFASRLLALLRDRLLATGFGAGADLDTYYAAFRVPDFLFNVLIFGAVSAAFIPIFAGYLARGEPDKANKIASVVLTIGTILIVIAASLAWIFAPQLTPLVAPGFSAAQMDQAVELTRVMLLSPIFFGLSGVFGSILQSNQRFVAYATAPLLYNLGIIAGALVAPEKGLVYLAYGVVLGAFLQMVMQLIAASRTGFRFKPSLNWRLPGVQRIFWLMIPTTIGVGIVQINYLVETIIASTLRVGSISQFFLATSLAMVPVSVFGLSFATSVFPVLAKAAETKQTELYVQNLTTVIRQILFFVIPISIAMLLLRGQIVRLIFGAGKFDFSDTRYVASLLGILAVSLFAQALIPLMSKAFYALRNTKTPVIIAGVAMGLNIIGALVFSHFFGVIGLAVALSAASVIQLGLLFFFLSGKVPELEDSTMFSGITKIVIAAAIMGLAMYGTLYGVDYFIQGLQESATVGFFAIQAIAASVVGAIVYLILTWHFDLPEARHFLTKLWHRKLTE